jgi:outer membrane protein assembly factor BamB
VGLPIAATLACLLGGCGSSHAKGTWPLPNADLAGTRAGFDSPIDRRTVSRLRVRWRFRLAAEASFAGRFASTPVSDADTVFVQDLRSNVFALDRTTGALRWERRFAARNDGPNGLAVDGSRVYGATDADAFALERSTGKLLWRRHLTGTSEQFVDVAPVPWKGLVFTSTIGYSPFGRGTIYALDAATGAVRWRFVTIEKPWRHPLEAGGGGLWYPVSVDAHGLLYAGNSNPTPWGGTPERPNGAAFPGPVPYTDSLLVLDAGTGKLLWHDQVTPHDVRDYDFAATPVLATAGGEDLVIGAGKAGRVIAWSRTSRQRLWNAAVGLHRNDLGPLPRRRVTVCPGLFGGVETPMAYAAGRVFVPVVDLCGPGSATTRQDVTAIDPLDGRGRLVALDAATGRTLWQRRLPAPDFGCATVANDVVFTSTFDGSVYALSSGDGSILWRAHMRAGVNACPALAGDLLVVGAGVRTGEGSVPEIVAFGLAD